MTTAYTYTDTHMTLWGRLGLHGQSNKSYTICMNKTLVVEIAQFKSKSGIADSDLLDASQEAQDGFLVQQKGFVSRELLKSNDSFFNFLGCAIIRV